MNHERVFVCAKNDSQFQDEVTASGQKFPRWTFDGLEKGVWTAGYAGWVLGRHGPEEYKRRAEVWRAL